MGRVYTFKEYGDSRLIKYDDLADIVAAYPRTMESGFAYICDKEVVEALGLADDYQKLFDKETMDKIIKLREESDLELFLGMDVKLQESTAKKIAERINANERIDYNYLRIIKEKTGIDIEDIANGLKDFSKKPEQEDEDGHMKGIYPFINHPHSCKWAAHFQQMSKHHRKNQKKPDIVQ